jgi:cell wall-associated NlpC family hydrolase
MLKYNANAISNINPYTFDEALSNVGVNDLDNDLNNIKQYEDNLINAITDITTPNVVHQQIYNTPDVRISYGNTSVATNSSSNSSNYDIPIPKTDITGGLGKPNVNVPSVVTNKKQSVATKNGNYYPISDVSKYNPNNKALNKIEKEYLGKPYVWGAKVGDKRGADCSSLTSCYAKNIGKNIPRTAYSQFKYFKQKGKLVNDINKANAGDLIYFNFRNKNKNPVGHTAIIKSIDANGIKVIEASSGHKKVIERYLPKTYYKHIVGIGKL